MSLLSQFFSSGSKNFYEIEILGVGGGAGGGTIPAGPYGIPGSDATYGGGAGQYVYKRTIINAGTQYPITIGAGGAVGSDGASTFFGSFQIFGGNSNGGIGTTVFSLGSSNGSDLRNISQIKVQGQQFGIDYFVGVNTGGYLPGGVNGGGGGGAFTSGIAPLGGGGVASGRGGAGMSASLIGYPTIYLAGGGNGGLNFGSPSQAPVGGGGREAAWGAVSLSTQPTPSTNAVANTGGGGGGGGYSGNSNTTPNTATLNLAVMPGSSGGSGVLFIRYPTAFAAATVTGNTPTPAQSGYHVYRWNSGPGTITFN